MTEIKFVATCSSTVRGKATPAGTIEQIEVYAQAKAAVRKYRSNVAADCYLQGLRDAASLKAEAATPNQTGEVDRT